MMNLPLVSLRQGLRRSSLRSTGERSPEGALLCRAVQVALALYLIPVLVLVLLMGGVGMCVVGTARLFATAPGATMCLNEAPQDRA